jgi:hypothetical protein
MGSFDVPRRALPRCKVDADRFLVPEYVQHALKHGRRKVHADDSAALVVVFEEHAGIVEPNPRERLLRLADVLRVPHAYLVDVEDSLAMLDDLHARVDELTARVDTLDRALSSLEQELVEREARPDVGSVSSSGAR